MIFADGGLAAILLVLWVFTLLDVITTPESQVRNLPKVVWFIVVLLLAELGIGALLWFVAGRPQAASRSMPYKGNIGRDPRIPHEYDRPGRAVAASPDDDAAFLAGLRERAEEQRKRAERERRRAENDGA